MSRSIWGVLGIAATADMREIRRAYARQLKITHPEDDASGFQELRMAYEQAMQLAAQTSFEAAQAEQEVPPAPQEHSYQPEPETVSPAQVVESDEELRQASELFSMLESALRKPEPDLAAENLALDRILKSPTLMRLDIQQRVELGLAAMLVDRIPRTDHLLAATVAHFEWDKREHENSLPMAARQIMARLGDVEFLTSIQKINDRNARAYRNLTTPAKPWRRWLRAHLAAEHPELEMLQYLSHRHPNLFAQIPREEVEWWQQFTQRPGPSRMLFISGLVIASLWTFGHFAGHAGEQYAGWWSLAVFAMVMGVTALLMLFKLYVIDWPSVLLYRHWQGPPPWKTGVGWLPAAIGAVLGALLTQPLGWVAWIFPAIAAGAVLWAMYATGPVPRYQWGKDIMDVRSVRAFFVNLIFLIYLLVLVDQPREQFSGALLATMVLALFASAFGRPIQMHYFFHLAPKIRMGILFAALFTVLAVGGLVLSFGVPEAVKPWLVVFALAITLLRRTLRHSIAIGGNVYAAIGVLVLAAIGSLMITTYFQLDGPVGEYGESPAPLMMFVVLLLIGAIAAIGREMHEMFKTGAFAARD